MAKLSYSARKKLLASQFAEPKQRKYPIEDASHARNALARVAQHGSAEEKKEVRQKVHKRYPNIS